MTIAEAFASSLPVVVPKLGGMPEIVDDGINGLHFQSKNAEDLAIKIRWAVANCEKTEEMGKNARKKYESQYTPEINYQQLIGIYQDIISNKVLK